MQLNQITFTLKSLHYIFDIDTRIKYIKCWSLGTLLQVVTFKFTFSNCSNWRRVHIKYRAQNELKADKDGCFMAAVHLLTTAHQVAKSEFSNFLNISCDYWLHFSKSDRIGKILKRTHELRQQDYLQDAAILKGEREHVLNLLISFAACHKVCLDFIYLESNNYKMSLFYVFPVVSISPIIC